LLGSLSKEEHERLSASLSDGEAAALHFEWSAWARKEQLTPPPPYEGWLILAGRGWGKTRTGAEAVRSEVESGRSRRIGLVAETSADGRDVVVEGESGILACSPPWARPLYEPSKRRLTWPNGAIATLYDAREPDQLRGPQHDFVWFDELAKYRYAEAVFDMAMFGLRVGECPRWLITTTPRPISLNQAGLQQQSIQQQMDDAAYQEFLRQIAYPAQQQQLRNQSLGLIPIQQTTTDTTQQSKSIWSNLLDALNTASKFASPFGSSNKTMS
jgi:phage terminase large subunit-like protein